MNPYTLASIILTFAVLITYINYRYIKIQCTITVMISSLIISLLFILLQHSGIANIADKTKILLIQTDFHRLLMNGMLSFLLFAGGLTIDTSTLRSKKWEILTLASVSTVASTLLVGTGVYYLLPLLGLKLPYLYALLFGALISPTDPIAVLSTFKEINAPKSLEICVAGESLFNDGVGIVIFITLYELTFQGVPINFQNISLLFIEQAIGGISYGAILGYLANRMIRNIDEPKIIILLTLVVVTGGYSLALALGISGPLAMVVAGIFIGNGIQKKVVNNQKNAGNNNPPSFLTVFWEVVDELLNAILFLLIGFELLTVNITDYKPVALILVIPLILLVRLITVAVPMKFIQRKKVQHEPYLISLLTWGGLRGGLAVALALALPPNNYRSLILALTYGVVVFSLVVQGLTIKPLAKLAREHSREHSKK